jgi:hypothetical protein
MDFGSIKDDLVRDYLSKKYGTNKVQNAQDEVDNAGLIEGGFGIADAAIGAMSQPIALQNRMQDLGKAPTVIEARKQPKTDVSGLTKQAQLKLDQATSDEDNAVKMAFEQRKAELAAEVAAKKADADAQRFQMEYDQKERGIDAQNRSRNAYADANLGLKREQLDLQRDRVAQDKATQATPKPLTSEAALKLANFKNALQAIDEMEKALDADQDTFTLFGDNDFTLAQDKFAEGYGRGSSVASITKDELDAFRSRTPGWMNNTYEKKAKIREIR